MEVQTALQEEPRSAPDAPHSVSPDLTFFATIINSLKEVVFQTDTEGKWTFLNPAWTEVTGFPVADCLHRNFLEFLHPDDREHNAQMFLPLIRRERDSCRHAVRYRTAGGGSIGGGKFLPA
ncbi:MAG: hypothetical protein OHK0029_12320 [Armatimonadaceae bacterium]